MKSVHGCGCNMEHMGEHMGRASPPGKRGVSTVADL